MFTFFPWTACPAAPQGAKAFKTGLVGEHKSSFCQLNFGGKGGANVFGKDVKSMCSLSIPFGNGCKRFRAPSLKYLDLDEGLG